ncbi:hypothetical protein [Nonomuraea sp. WAC 01424]|uniref:hypothetical protein n=1 Tax=Nonomuraea sp. WAC 01424 TaxID=2203200 RepID=UPI000F76C7C1|nr:hypothetical protein [Nonomuraea sp. WAC 01424]
MRIMVLLGLLLMVAGSAAVAVLFTRTTATATADLTLLGITFRVGDLELFSAGAATAAAFIFGAFLIAAGTSRRLARRRELRRLLTERADDRTAAPQTETAPAPQTESVPAQRTESVPAEESRTVPARRRAPADRLVAGRRRPATG